MNRVLVFEIFVKRGIFMLLPYKTVKTAAKWLLLTGVFLLLTAVSCGKTDAPETVTASDMPVSSEEVVLPVDVSLSDVSMELGYGITRSIKAVGGQEIKWSSSDETIASVDAEGNVKGVELGECVITAVNEFGRTAQCEVVVKKTCYLSIDDGPLANAGRIMNALDETGVKATFFVVDNIYFDAVKRMHDDGHVIGLHTKWNNTKHCYKNMFIYYTDLDILNDKIESLTGSRSGMLRFPGGSSNSVSDPLTMRRIINGAHDLGYRVFDWTVSAADAKADSTYENSCALILALCTNKQEIVLMHDKSFTPRVIRKVVPILKERGYVFETLDHYPEQSYEFMSRYSRQKPDYPAQSVELKQTEVVLETGGKVELEADMTPRDATDFIVWQSSDDAVAQVDKGGVVTGVRPGEAVITAATTSGKTASCKITVVEAPAE